MSGSIDQNERAVDRLTVDGAALQFRIRQIRIESDQPIETLRVDAGNFPTYTEGKRELRRKLDRIGSEIALVSDRARRERRGLHRARVIGVAQQEGRERRSAAALIVRVLAGESSIERKRSRGVVVLEIVDVL